MPPSVCPAGFWCPARSLLLLSVSPLRVSPASLPLAQENYKRLRLCLVLVEAEGRMGSQCFCQIHLFPKILRGAPWRSPSLCSFSACRDGAGQEQPAGSDPAAPFGNRGEKQACSRLESPGPAGGSRGRGERGWPWGTGLALSPRGPPGPLTFAILLGMLRPRGCGGLLPENCWERLSPLFSPALAQE